MRTQFKICNEADYLRAHMTVIERRPAEAGATLHTVKEQVASTVKKWVSMAMGVGARN
jgi:hypothetical protein